MCLPGQGRGKDFPIGAAHGTGFVHILGEQITVDTSHEMPLMDAIIPLPGKGCLFYRNGHCLHEEMVNPGFCIASQCTLLRGLQDAFDAFVDRAECFRLEEQAAGRIWEHLAARLSARASCAHYIEDPQREHGECLYLFDNACILLCPSCSGRCSLFQIQTTHSY